MSQPEPLPELNQATLDVDTLRQLFFDIEHSAELLGVSVKQGGERHAAEAALSLSEVCELLLAGSVLGAQLRYVHAGKEWWDTLLPTPSGIRLVRIDQSHLASRSAILPDS